MSLLGFDAIGRYAIGQLPFVLSPGNIPMSSQTDLDQGGTYRQTQRVYLGPSVGWQYVPNQTVYPITAAGTYTIARGINLITVNVNGNVTIQLPSSLASPAGPQAIPGQWAMIPIVIVDIGGFAATNQYNILTYGAELISGLYNSTTQPLRINSNYGAFVLSPILLSPGGWSLSQS